MISVPFQNNVNFQQGQYRGTVINVLNIQPIIPFPASARTGISSRTILPVIDLPHVAERTAFRPRRHQSDVLPSPSHPDGLIWGVGLTLSAPTATDKLLGTESGALAPPLSRSSCPAIG